MLVLGLAQMELELFAECPIRLDESKGKTLSTFVETVVDSSRYFVLRCEVRLYSSLILYRPLIALLGNTAS